eukprot:511431-Hanusia_phi.AAC.1
MSASSVSSVQRQAEPQAGRCGARMYGTVGRRAARRTTVRSDRLAGSLSGQAGPLAQGQWRLSQCRSAGPDHRHRRARLPHGSRRG